MTNQILEKAVTDRYKKKYPLWTDLKVEEVVDPAFGGAIVVVQAKDENKIPADEICFVHPGNKVRVFETTTELAHFLEARAATPPLLERIFSQPVMSGIIFLLLLVALCVLAVWKKDLVNDHIATILGSVVGTAAGFFFGTNKGHSPAWHGSKDR